MQNKSHAVMAQRIEASDSADDFPTPPWATRALIQHVIGNMPALKQLSCLEPACGAGHMAKVLKEYFGEVENSDAFDYGYGKTRDFLNFPYRKDSYDWVITNPPFRLAEEFIDHALSVSRCGVAILARTVFLESIGRYERIFNLNPPTVFAQFAERVPMIKGRVDKNATTATGYAWFVWDKSSQEKSKLAWIPPCRKKLEFLNDYELPTHSDKTSTERELQFSLRG